MTDYVFECDNGDTYGCKPPFCAICQHCTDYFWDYSNGPYLFLCELSKDNENHDCQYFLLNEDAITVEDYITQEKLKFKESLEVFDSNIDLKELYEKVLKSI